MSYLDERRKHIEAGRPLPEKKKYKLNPVSPKRQAKIDAEKLERGDDDTFLVRWYKSKIKISSGYCSECGCKVEKNIYKYAIMTVCHLLPKRDSCCPSVKTHIMNFVILCPDHHDMYDKASWEEREMMGCWNIVRDRLIMVYLDLAESERRFFPESILTYMNNHNPF